MKKLPLLQRSRTTATGSKTKTTPAKSTKRQISFNQAAGLVLALSIITIGAGGYYWYQNVFTNTDRVFNDMLNKSMQTTSIYRNVYQENGRNSIDQTIYTGYTPKTVAQSVTKLEDNSARNKTLVTTETIGTETEDYIRYTAVDIGGKQSITGIDKVLNVWGKRQANNETGESVSFLSDALFVVVPFGNLNADQRQQLTQEMQKTKLYKIKQAKTDFSSGRPTVDYIVSINPKALVQVLAKYVELTGLQTNAQLDPNSYQDAQALDVQMQIDLLSRHLKTVSFVDTQRSETYGAYNLFREIESPQQTVPVRELQQRLQVLEQQQTGQATQ